MRYLAAEASKTLGQPIVLTNQASAAGTVGVSQAASAIASVMNRDHRIKRELDMKRLLVRIGAIIA
jgi:hypothetical protein